MGQQQYLSTDPNAGTSVASSGYLSTDPNAGAAGPPNKTPSMLDMALADNPAQSPLVRAGVVLARLAKNNPAQAGAMTGGALAAPLTGGMSLPAAMAIVGGGSALGAGAGQLASGETPSLGTMAKEGAIGATGTGVVRLGAPAIRGTLRLIRGAPNAAIDALGYVSPRTASALRILRRMGTGQSENAGGRLVRPPAAPSVEESMADALTEIRRPTPQSVSLPPPPQLPPGYQPRTSVPALAPTNQANAGGRLVRTPAEADPSVEDVMARVLKDLQVTPPPRAVSLPSPRELPSGYQPRTSVPRTGAAAQEPVRPADVPSSESSAPFAGEGLSAYERAALNAELHARGLSPTIRADDAARYLREYGQLIPPGTRQARQGMHIQDALSDARYRFHLNNPASALALGTTGAATFRDALLAQLLGEGER